MKHLIVPLCIISFIAGCNLVQPKNPWPQVGDCFERFLADRPSKTDDGYELDKVVAVNPKAQYDQIEIVYNFPNEPNFQKGRWYTIKYLNWESKDTFFRDYGSPMKPRVNKIACPW
jgi:hypothetical protein